MTFEVYIQEQHLTKELWKKFIGKVEKKLHLFETAHFEVYLGVDELSFFLHTKKDISKLSQKFLPFLLKHEHTAPSISYSHRKHCFAVVNNVDNFLTLKERYEYDTHRQLKKITFTLRKYLFHTTYNATFYFQDVAGTMYIKRKRFWHFPAYLLDIDFSKSIKYKKRPVPIYVKLQQVLTLFSKQKELGFLEVQGFPYLDTPEYLPINQYEFNKHSLIVGQTGTGKSKFIQLFVNQLYLHGLTKDYTVVVIDPHATMYADFVTVPENINIDFLKTSCKLFAKIGEPKVATELTILLFQTLMKDQFNPKMERVLKYALFVLFVTNNMSLEALRKFLTELSFRKEILATPGVQENIIQFFDTEFLELETKFYELSMMPILVLLDELVFLPISNFQESDSLEQLINDNTLVFLSLNKIFLGDKATKLVAGLLIQQLFLLAQSRATKKKLLFIIDEVSVVQNDALGAILSEARKFGLSLFLTQQYLGQVDTNLLKSIIANVYNYFIFKVAEDDAKLLVNNLEFDFTPEQVQMADKDKGLSESDLRTRMITTLNPRECVTRVYKDGKFYPVFKAKTLTI